MALTYYFHVLQPCHVISWPGLHDMTHMPSYLWPCPEIAIVSGDLPLPIEN